MQKMEVMNAAQGICELGAMGSHTRVDAATKREATMVNFCCRVLACGQDKLLSLRSNCCKKLSRKRKPNGFAQVFSSRRQLKERSRRLAL